MSGSSLEPRRPDLSAVRPRACHRHLRHLAWTSLHHRDAAATCPMRRDRVGFIQAQGQGMKLLLGGGVLKQSLDRRFQLDHLLGKEIAHVLKSLDIISRLGFEGPEVVFKLVERLPKLIEVFSQLRDLLVQELEGGGGREGGEGGGGGGGGGGGREEGREGERKRGERGGGGEGRGGGGGGREEGGRREGGGGRRGGEGRGGEGRGGESAAVGGDLPIRSPR